MIHIVTHRNRHIYTRQIWEMFNERRRVFVERAGWKDLMVFEGAEVDDFDDERAVYLLALDGDGELQGALRARPTEDRCILADKYGHMIAADQPPMKGKDVWELTRMLVTDSFRRGRMPGVEIRQALTLACLEVALDAGATRVVGMVELSLYPHATDAAWNVRMAGLPVQYPYGVMVAVWAPVSEAEVVRFRDSLAEPVRISYFVDDDDIASFGDITAVQREFERARAIDPLVARRDQAKSRQSIAHIEALYAKYDCGGGYRSRNVIPLPLPPQMMSEKPADLDRRRASVREEPRRE
jgi:acyl-homoserine lactone synthase